MVLGRVFGNQFIEVIEWTDDDSQDIIMYRFPVENKEIKMGAQLTVRESQVAIFVNEGQIADIFEPGRYTLSTENMPVLTKLKSWKYGFDSPFKAEVYFVNTKRFPEQKWGTSNPVMMRDQEFGVVRFRAFGVFGFRVHDPEKFMKELAGTNETYSTEHITKQLRNVIVSGLSEAVAQSEIPALDLTTKYSELADTCMETFEPKFNEYGLSLSSFVINNISLPQEVEDAIDKRTSMGAIGDLNSYTQYQAANAMEDAANNEGGVAGAGAGMGAGIGMGQAMAGAFNQSQQQPQQQQQQVQCPKCNGQAVAGAKFCPQCGESMQPDTIACPGCNNQIDESSKFCPQCGQSMSAECNNCNAELQPSAKFCPKCGTQQ